MGAEEWPPAPWSTRMTNSIDGWKRILIDSVHRRLCWLQNRQKPPTFSWTWVRWGCQCQLSWFRGEELHAYLSSNFNHQWLVTGNSVHTDDFTDVLQSSQQGHGWTGQVLSYWRKNLQGIPYCGIEIIFYEEENERERRFKARMLSVRIVPNSLKHFHMS